MLLEWKLYLDNLCSYIGNGLVAAIHIHLYSFFCYGFIYVECWKLWNQKDLTSDLRSITIRILMSFLAAGSVEHVVHYLFRDRDSVNNGSVTS